jgi:hypothetical protein
MFSETTEWISIKFSLGRGVGRINFGSNRRNKRLALQ